MILPAPLVAIMELALNRALQLDEHTLERVIELQGKIIGIDLLGFDIQFYLAPALDGVQVLAEYEGEADTFIRGTPVSMLRTAVSDDRSTLFKGQVVIDGDMQLGQKFQHILDDLELDWEEPLSQMLGDVAAHQIGDVVRQFSGWAKSAINSLTLNTSEYFQEETRDVVNPVEVERFANQVDKTRADVDRMEQHIQKMTKKIEGV